jgi:hypothetical protein
MQYDGIIGYPAAILLFCITDAIGHHLDNGKGDIHKRDTYLEVLNHPYFGLKLSTEPKGQIDQIKRWFRNPLLHAASIVPDVLITPEDHGDPFDFTNSPVKLRVPRFYEIVKRAWEKLNEAPPTFNPLNDTLKKNKSAGIEPSPVSNPVFPTMPSPSGTIRQA